eukprot:412146_1
MLNISIALQYRGIDHVNIIKLILFATKQMRPLIVPLIALALEPVVAHPFMVEQERCCLIVTDLARAPKQRSMQKTQRHLSMLKAGIHCNTVVYGAIQQNIVTSLCRAKTIRECNW